MYPEKTKKQNPNPKLSYYADSQKIDNYKAVEQIYKRGPIPTDYSGAIDFLHLENNSTSNQSLIQKIKLPVPCESLCHNAFDEMYTLTNLPGFYFIPNPFTDNQQKYWITKCIKEYPIGNPTNISNLSDNQNMWTEFKKENMKGLRWTSLGYHFQWGPRVYESHKHSPYPAELQDLASHFGSLVCTPMRAQASIINFYASTKDKMGAHVDDSEKDMSKPIVSFSWGNTVVFLLGGRTKETAPMAILIRSGDVIMMHGETRYAFHSVPRMIENTTPDFILNNNDDEWKDEQEYITGARINMNCRQVMHDNETEF